MAYTKISPDEAPGMFVGTPKVKPEVASLTDSPTYSLKKPIGYQEAKKLADKPALTVAEAAALTGFSRQTVTRLFEKETGVLMVKHPTTNRKRRYRSIRIPRPVFERVMDRISNR